MAYGLAEQPAVVIDRQRLRKSVDWSRQRLRWARDCRYKFTTLLAGSNYGEHLSDFVRRKVSYNPFEQACSTYTRQLFPSSPRILVSTFNSQQMATGKLFEIALNRRLKEINWDEVLQRAAKDAVISMAMAKISVCQDADGQTRIYLDLVDLDDAIFDMSVKCFDYCAFIGNRFRIPLEEAKNRQEYNGMTADGVLCRERLRQSSRKITNEDGNKRIEQQGVTQDGSDAEPVDMVELYELYLPMENKIVTLSVDQTDLPPLRDEPWVGPKSGPFIECGLDDVPGNIFPLSPLMQLYDISSGITTMVTREVDDALAYKKIGLAQSNDANDAKIINETVNGHTAAVQNIGATREVEYRGVTQMQIASIEHLDGKQDRQGGNLSTLGGLQTEANTLGQEELLNTNASGKVKPWQTRFRKFVQRIAEAVAWHLWHEAKDGKVAVDYKIGDLAMLLPVNPEGEFDDYDFEIDPYSMQDVSPQGRLQMTQSFLTNVAVPFAASMQAAGKTLDFQALMEMFSRYTNTPEIASIIVDLPPPPIDLMGAGGSPSVGAGPSIPTRNPGASQTTRNYVRHSKGANQKASLMKTMLSGAQKETAGAA